MNNGQAACLSVLFGSLFSLLSAQVLHFAPVAGIIYVMMYIHHDMLLQLETGKEKDDEAIPPCLLRQHGLPLD